MSPHDSSAIGYFIVFEHLFSMNCDWRAGDRVDSWHMPVELRWSNVAYNIDKTVVTESRGNRVAWSEEFVQTYKDELCSTNFKLCVQEAVSVLSTNVDKSVDIIARALYGAAACMVKTVGHKKKKRATDWFDQECARMKRLVRRQLCKFRRTNNLEQSFKVLGDNSVNKSKVYNL